MGRPKSKPVNQEIKADQASDDLPFNENLPFIHPDLQKTLEKYPHIDCVWMDENGTWFFAEKPGFTAYSREQILNG